MRLSGFFGAFIRIRLLAVSYADLGEHVSRPDCRQMTDAKYEPAVALFFVKN